MPTNAAQSWVCEILAREIRAMEAREQNALRDSNPIVAADDAAVCREAAAIFSRMLAEHDVQVCADD